jgi:hypothetical protein
MTVRIPLLAPAAVAVALLAAPAVGGASGSHWCRQGDPPILASARTSCALAGAIVDAYANARRPASGEWAGRVRDPGTGERHRICCTRRGDALSGTVRCRGERGSGIRARFSAAPF